MEAYYFLRRSASNDGQDWTRLYNESFLKSFSGRNHSAQRNYRLETFLLTTAFSFLDGVVYEKQRPELTR